MLSLLAQVSGMTTGGLIAGGAAGAAIILVKVLPWKQNGSSQGVSDLVVRERVASLAKDSTRHEDMIERTWNAVEEIRKSAADMKASAASMDERTKGLERLFQVLHKRREGKDGE